MCVPKSVFKHIWNNSLQKGTAKLNARVCIHFNQPRIEFLIDHKVKPEYLEISLSSLWVQEKTSCLDCVSCDLLHSRYKRAPEIHIFAIGSKSL
jgi:hypothetical protein